jgi:cell division protease FtsH
MSDSTRMKIDDEVRRLTEESYKRALGLIKQHRQSLDMLAEALMHEETLTGQQV